MIKVVITDDHKLIRDGIKALLQEEADIEIVGEASDGNQLLEMLPKTSTDVVVLDLSMPGKNGIDIIRQIKSDFPKVKVLVLTMLNFDHHVQQAIDAGALGYMLKDTGKEELVSAIKLVANGTSYISSNVTMNLLRKQGLNGNGNGYSQEQTTKQTKDLTKRELEVLHLIAEGLTNAAIAEKLFTSKRTVETHRQNLLEKTQTKNTATLIKFALKNGLIS